MDSIEEDGANKVILEEEENEMEEKEEVTVTDKNNQANQKRQRILSRL